MNFKMILAILISVFICRAEFEWLSTLILVEGPQFDVKTGPDGKIHMITSSYYQLDENGQILLTEDIADDWLCDMCFPPALATGPDSSVHILTRHGGNWDDGHTINYRKRSSDGTWTSPLKITDPVNRNYVVGVTVLDNNRVFCMHSKQNGTNVHADILMYEINGSSKQYLGKTSSADWLRIDADYRLDSYGNRLHLFSGSPWPSGKTYYFSTDVTSTTDVPAALSSSKKEHNDGSGRKCIPNVYAWGSGGTDITYGAEYAVYYNRYLSNGNTLFNSDKKVLDNLGEWHLKSGSSGLGVSDDGQKVLIVGIKSNGEKPGDGTLVYTFSENGGQTFSAQQALLDNFDRPITTSGGEGRIRPKIVWIKERFIVFYDYGTYIGLSIFKDPATEIQSSESKPNPGDPEISVTPNPFNPSTTITVSGVNSSANITLRIYDSRGQMVGSDKNRHIKSTRTNGSSAMHYTWDATGIPTGVYTAVIETSFNESLQQSRLTKKLVLAK